MYVRWLLLLSCWGLEILVITCCLSDIKRYEITQKHTEIMKTRSHRLEADKIA